MTCPWHQLYECEKPPWLRWNKVTTILCSRVVNRTLDKTKILHHIWSLLVKIKVRFVCNLFRPEYAPANFSISFTWSILIIYEKRKYPFMHSASSENIFHFVWFYLELSFGHKIWSLPVFSENQYQIDISVNINKLKCFYLWQK